MGNFNRDRNQGGRRFGGGGGRFDRDRRPVQMYPATCSNCGKACEVPFKPTGSKPVLCNDCFRGGGADNRNDRGNRSDRPQLNDRRNDSLSQNKEQFDSLHQKLDKILGILQSQSTLQAPIEEVVVEEKVAEKKKRTPKKEKAEEVVVETEANVTEEAPATPPTE